MAVNKRLTKTNTGDGNDSIINAPTNVERDTGTLVGDTSVGAGGTKTFLSTPKVLADSSPQISSLTNAPTLVRDVRLGESLVTGSATNEVQTVATTGTPTGGTFTLSLTSEGITATTGTIAFNAAASAVQTALEALPNVGTGNVVCAGGPLTTAGVTCTFQVRQGGRDVPSLVLANNSLTGGTTPSVTITETTKGGSTTTFVVPTTVTPTPTNATAAVHRITMGTGTGGSFTLTFRGKTTDPINVSGISASSIQTAIRALDLPNDPLSKPPLVSPTATATVSGSGPYDIAYPKAVGAVSDLPTVNGANVSGGSAPTIASQTTGALGSVSIAYSGGTTGDRVAVSVRSTTGRVHTSGGVVTASPAVITGLVPDAYTAVIRGVAGTAPGTVSKQASASFTIA